MSTTYAGLTLAEIKEAAAKIGDDGNRLNSPPHSELLLAMIARIEEMERTRDAAQLAGFRAAQEMAAKHCDRLAEEFYSAAASRCASSIRAMQLPVSEHDRSSYQTQGPVEADWPHPDGFPAIAGMP